MLEEVFLQVVRMSFQAGLVIAVLCLIRPILKRFPRKYMFVLWFVVLVRLLCPLNLELAISPVPDISRAVEIGERVSSEASGEKLKVVTAVSQSGKRSDVPAVKREETTASQPIRVWKIGVAIWLVGMSAMLLYGMVSWLRIRRRVAEAVRYRDNIYQIDGELSPFVYGILRPAIYLPECLQESEKGYILAHERYHIRRRDPVTKLAAFVTVCIHWFNPLVWLMFFLFCRDMEMSCDEAVIRQLGSDIRADYASSLLSLAVRQPVSSGIPVNFGEPGTRHRVRNLASQKITARWAIGVLIPCLLVIGVLLLSTRKEPAAPMKLTDGQYVMEGLVDAWGFSPTITFNTKEQTFAYSYSILSSYLGYGHYEIDKDEVILRTDDGEYVITFQILDERSISLIADKSDTLPAIEHGEVPDGAVFRTDLSDDDVQTIFLENRIYLP